MKIILTNIPSAGSVLLIDLLSKRLKDGVSRFLSVLLVGNIPPPPKDPCTIWMSTDQEIDQDFIAKILEIYKGYSLACVIDATKKMPHLEPGKIPLIKDVVLIHYVAKPEGVVSILCKHLDLAEV